MPEFEIAAAGAAAADPDPADWGIDRSDDIAGDLPAVDSPPIAAETGMHAADDSWSQPQEDEPPTLGPAPGPARAGRLGRAFARPQRPRASMRRFVWPAACAVMGGMVFALLNWRAPVVQMLPQTDAFYRAIGLDVNLRGLVFKDVKVTTETMDGRPVLLIEGSIFDIASKPVDLPRLRFAVRDEKGSEIYTWTATLEQPTLNPGEKAWFRSRLVAPPSEARRIDVRFFGRHDLATGGV